MNISDLEDREKYLKLDLSDESRKESPNTKNIKTFQVETIEKNIPQSRTITVENIWQSDNNFDVGKILNGVCLKLIQGDNNYGVILEWLLNNIIRVLESEIGLVCAVSDPNNFASSTLTCVAIGEREAGMITRRCIKMPNGNQCIGKTVSGIFGYSISTNQIIISTNVNSDPRIKLNIPMNHPEIRNMIIIPLKYNDYNIGVLSVANTQKTYTIDSIKYILPLIEICTKILMKYQDTKETLASQIQRISSANEAKEKFLAIMSHELRTPLNGIMGMVTLLPDAGPLNDKQREYVRNLTECSVELTGLLNNILDFSKMTADRLVLQKHPLNIQDVISDSIRIVEGSIYSKNLELKVHVSKDIPIMIGDRQRLVQILTNLLTNSNKFTDKGYISISVQASPIESAKRETSGLMKKWKISFQIKDTGLGISLEDQDKIFEAFYQSSNISTYLSKSGAGLGLSIVRELTRLMGGKISVESSGVPGEGCTFSFYIILDEEINTDLLEEKNIKILSGSKILIVDDRPEIRLHLSDVLFKWKCQPQSVSSAEEALQYLSYSSNFRVVLVDINMPNMSGVELAIEIRRSYPHIPLIGISSVDLSAGEEYFDFYMYKPIEQHILFPALIKCLSNPQRKKSRHRKSKRRLKILVAEDDKHNIFTMRELLINLGYKKENITFAQDGDECVRLSSSDNYDVILMDIIMPKINGIEATRIIKRNSHHPMIIAVSAAVHSSDKAKCQGVGFDGYLSKPIIKDRLEAALSPLIKTSNKKRNKNKL